MVLRFRRKSWVGALAVAVVPAVMTALAAAAPVAPGGSVTTDDDTFQMPTGEKLAEKVLNFTLQFPAPAGMQVQPAPSTTGSITSSVFRNASTGGLTFVYDVDVTDAIEYTDEVARLTVGSFAGFTTDASGDFPSSTIFPVTRSADGATLAAERKDGQGSPPLFVIDTDAKAFNANGTARYDAAAEFVITDPANPGEGQQTTHETSATINGVFQPTADDGGPGPTPVPLPPALWAALGTAGLLGAGAKGRRWLRC